MRTKRRFGKGEIARAAAVATVLAAAFLGVGGFADNGIECEHMYPSTVWNFGEPYGLACAYTGSGCTYCYFNDGVRAGVCYTDGETCVPREIPLGP